MRISRAGTKRLSPVFAAQAEMTSVNGSHDHQSFCREVRFTEQSHFLIFGRPLRCRCAAATLTSCQLNAASRAAARKSGVRPASASNSRVKPTSAAVMVDRLSAIREGGTIGARELALAPVRPSITLTAGRHP